MTTTGLHHEEIATALYDAGHTVSIVPPEHIQGYIESEFPRNTTIKWNADLLAAFVAAEKPGLWHSPTAENIQFKEFTYRLAYLKEDRALQQKILNEGVHIEFIQESIKQIIAVLDNQIEELEKAIEN